MAPGADLVGNGYGPNFSPFPFFPALFMNNMLRVSPSKNRLLVWYVIVVVYWDHVTVIAPLLQRHEFSCT